MRALALAFVLASVACGGSPTSPTSPSPAAPTNPPVFQLQGNSGDACLPAENFYPSWVVVVSDAGDAGMDIRVTLETIPSADCQQPFQGTGVRLYAYGNPTIAPRQSGSVSFVLDQHLSCGSGRYRAWNGNTVIGATRVTAGTDC